MRMRTKGLHPQGAVRGQLEGLAPAERAKQAHHATSARRRLIENWGLEDGPRLKRARLVVHAAKPDCANCPFAVEGKPNRPVLGAIPLDPIGLMVGEAPGPQEAEAGVPFSGMTGQELDTSLAGVGLPRSRLALIYAVSCLPPPGKNVRQMHKAVLCCRALLLYQLMALHPGIPTFAMGRSSVFALTGREKGVLKVRGFIDFSFRLPRGDRTVDEAHEVIREGIKNEH